MSIITIKIWFSPEHKCPCTKTLVADLWHAKLMSSRHPDLRIWEARAETKEELLEIVYSVFKRFGIAKDEIMFI